MSQGRSTNQEIETAHYIIYHYKVLTFTLYYSLPPTKKKGKKLHERIKQNPH